MTPTDLHDALQALPPSPPRPLSADAVLRRAATTRRRRATALLSVAGLLAGLAVVGAQHRTGPPAELARPPATIVYGGLVFERREQEPFVLRPGIQGDDPRTVLVTVPEPWVPDGPCAVLDEPVVARETDDEVVLATWRYTPAPPSTPSTEAFACAGVGHGDRTVRLRLDRPLGDRPLLIAGREGPSQVLLLGPDGEPVRADLAPDAPDSAEICLDGDCAVQTDRGLLQQAAAAVDRAQEVRPGQECSDGDRPYVDRTYRVRFTDDGRTGPALDVPLGCAPLGVVGEPRRFADDVGGPDEVRIAYDQQIEPETQCLGIGGPSGGPPTKDYVGLTLAQAQQRAEATHNDVVRVAGRDGTCEGVVRDHVINRVNVYLVEGVVAAAKSF